MGWVFEQAQGVWSGPLLWSGWLLSSSAATPHRFLQIHINTIIDKYKKAAFEIF